MAIIIDLKWWQWLCTLTLFLSGSLSLALPGLVSSTSAPDQEGVGADLPAGDAGCFLDLCQLGSPICANGGTCEFSDCSAQCTCPPPYDDSELYDQSCRLRDTSNTTTSFSGAQLNSSDTSLRPQEERDCLGNGQVVCIHGYCNVTGDSFRCVCDQGWISDMCDEPCGRNCSNEGSCWPDTVNNKELCECPYPWIGPYCEDLPPEEEADRSWVKWLIIALTVGFLVLLALAALFMYCLWRKRLVFALKIVYYFKSPEENDGRLYDAFVSYVANPDDEDFVYKTLYPKLEQDMGFALCLQRRDFLVGEAVSDNILKALEESRRFILVLSPRYLESEWAEFEYQRAFKDMLELKTHIIPIILEDISQRKSMNPTLQAILDSVTYLKFPGPTADKRQLNKFWKRIHLSMPKKSQPSSDLTRDAVTDSEIGQVEHSETDRAEQAKMKKDTNIFLQSLNMKRKGEMVSLEKFVPLDTRQSFLWKVYQSGQYVPDLQDGDIKKKGRKCENNPDFLPTI